LKRPQIIQFAARMEQSETPFLDALKARGVSCSRQQPEGVFPIAGA
jgi:hypothetical protein